MEFIDGFDVMRLAEARLKCAGEIIEASESTRMGRRANPKHFLIKYNLAYLQEH